MRKFLTLAQFAEAARNGAAPGDVAIRTGGTPADLANDSGRLISYRFSDESVARDGATIASDGWDLRAFQTNPVFLWAHLSDDLPIGKVVDIQIANGVMRGTVEYADRDLYPFADTVFRLVKGGYLNATSVSWIPLEWKFSTDRNRPGGIDYKRQELLEISQVPVPALVTALVTARGAGIDTSPIYEWASRVLDSGDMLLVPRAELETLRRDAKMPSAKRVKEPVAEITEKPAVTEDPTKPEPARTAPAPTAPAPTTGRRGLWAVSYLAMMLEDLGYLQESSEIEAAREEDNSPVPAQFLDALKMLGAVLVAMTIEEVNELLAGDDEDVASEVYMAAAKSPAQRALRLLAMTVRDAGAGLHTRYFVETSSELSKESVEKVAVSFRKWLANPRSLLVLPPTMTMRTVEPSTQRAGKMLSSDNERCLRDALGHHEAGSEMIRGLLARASDGSDDPEDDPEDPDDDQARARARATVDTLRLKHS